MLRQPCKVGWGEVFHFSSQVKHLLIHNKTQSTQSTQNSMSFFFPPPLIFAWQKYIIICIHQSQPITDTLDSLIGSLHMYCLHPLQTTLTHIYLQPNAHCLWAIVFASLEVVWLYLCECDASWQSVLRQQEQTLSVVLLCNWRVSCSCWDVDIRFPSERSFCSAVD